MPKLVQMKPSPATGAVKVWIISATLTVGGNRKGGRLEIRYGAVAEDETIEGNDHYRHAQKMNGIEMERFVREHHFDRITFGGVKDNEVTFHLSENDAFRIVDEDHTYLQSMFRIDHPDEPEEGIRACQIPRWRVAEWVTRRTLGSWHERRWVT